jgi:dihydrodipicolinate synthase/N-acetylneuraminate lyase
MRTKFTGLGTALVTPFTRSGDVDEQAVRRLGRRQIASGTHFLVPVGATGENPTLDTRERIRIVQILVDEAKGGADPAVRRIQPRGIVHSRKSAEPPAPTGYCR